MHQTKHISIKIKFILLMLCRAISIKAQQDSSSLFKLKLDGYVETYYLYDFQQPNKHLRPSFCVSHNRHNEFNVNLGLVRFKAENEKVKATFGFMAGT